MKPIVCLESPFAGSSEHARKENLRYVVYALRDSFRRDEVPIASHPLYAARFATDTFHTPPVLNDADPSQRYLGMQAGHEWLRVVDKVVVYEDRGVTAGMLERIRLAEDEGVVVEYRKLGGEWAR